MDALRALAIDLDLTLAHGLRVRLTGSVALAEEELASVETGMGFANGAALVLVGVLLVVGLRTVRLVVPVLITLVMGLVWTAALALVMVGSLNLISVAFAVLFIGLGVDFGIHFSLRYREGRERHPDALGWAAANVGGPLALSAGGAGIGFFSFLPTPYQGFAELGLIAGVGMFIALMANLTVLPALLTLMPLPVPSPSPRVRSVMAWSPRRLMVRRARLLAWGSVLLAAAAMTALPAARFDLDPLNLKDSGTESVSTVRELMKDERHGPHGIVILADSPAQARDLAERLGRLPTVASVATLFDYVPHDQDEKLHMIGDMALFLSPLFASHHRMEEPDPAETRQALTDLMQTLATFADPHAQALLEALRRIPWEEPTAAVPALETALLATLPQRLEALRDALQAGPVTLADLPPALRAREMTADGRTRVEIHPREDITDRAALGRFVETVRTIAPQATGTPVSLYESGQAVLYSFHLATGITVLALLVLLTVLLRRVRDVLLAFAPLVLAALLTNALAVMIGLPYNFANIIALPLLFGIGIANGIQFVFRERLEGGALAVLDTTTPRAVVFSALTTVISFGSLALSTHPGTASMGLLLGIAITVTLLVTLFVLPALMLTLPRRAPS
ncbi:MAG: hypothetical protein FD149_629 [Rhodospirillaceae bacterium]|nr:MAG: hypothetical protein FD149_629 [Rhodospirillaceae bacterium]